MVPEMSHGCYAWSCPITDIRKCNVSPRLIESQFTVSTRRSFAAKRSFAIKRTESPLYHLSSKPNNVAKFESKRDQATSWQLSVPKQRLSRQDLKNRDCDKNVATTQKRIEMKKCKTRKFRSPSSKTSKCRIRKSSICANRSIQTERQGVLSHFTSMVDVIGTTVVDNAAPWIPYVGATALAIILFGYFSKKVEKALCIYNTANELLSTFHFHDIPLLGEGCQAKESPVPEPPPPNGATVDPHTLRFHYNKLKWPEDPLTIEFLKTVKS